MFSLFRGFRECFPNIFWIFRVGLPSDNSNKATEKKLSLIWLFHCTAPLSREETCIELRTNCTVACDKCDKFCSGAKRRLTIFRGLRYVSPIFWVFRFLACHSITVTKRPKRNFLIFLLFSRTVPLFRGEKLPGITNELYCSVRQVLEWCKEKVNIFSGIKICFPNSLSFSRFALPTDNSIETTEK